MRRDASPGDAAGTRAPAEGREKLYARGHGRRRRTGLRRERIELAGPDLAVGLLVGLLNVDPALEEGAIFNADALRHDVTGERALIADVHTIGGVEVAPHLADHHNLTR